MKTIPQRMGKVRKNIYAYFMILVLVAHSLFGTGATHAEAANNNITCQVLAKANLRRSPSMDADIMATVESGEKVALLSESINGYSLISFDGLEGYIFSGCISVIKENMVQDMSVGNAEHIGYIPTDVALGKKKADYAIFVQPKNESNSTQNNIENNIENIEETEILAMEEYEERSLVSAWEIASALKEHESDYALTTDLGANQYFLSRVSTVPVLVNNRTTSEEETRDSFAMVNRSIIAKDALKASNQEVSTTTTVSNAPTVNQTEAPRAKVAAEMQPSVVENLTKTMDVVPEVPVKTAKEESREAAMLANQVLASQISDTGTKKTVTMNANMRLRANQYSDWLMSVPYGAEVMVYSQTVNGYSLVQYNGNIGYLWNGTLGEYNANVSSPMPLVSTVNQVEPVVNGTAVAYVCTAYCSCAKCCGIYSPEVTGGVSHTATGTIPEQGRTIAVDPRKIPYGTHVYIEGYGEFIAEDTGGAIQGNRIDVYFESHAAALQFGRRTLMVTILP